MQRCTPLLTSALLDDRHVLLALLHDLEQKLIRAAVVCRQGQPWRQMG